MAWEVAFLLGISFGLAIYRTMIAVVLGYNPNMRCDYCKWYCIKKSRHRW